MPREHDSYAPGETQLTPEAQVAVLRAALQCQKEMPELKATLTRRTELLRRYLYLRDARNYENISPHDDVACLDEDVRAELARDA